jgi:RNA-directed DNA polymerase
VLRSNTYIDSNRVAKKRESWKNLPWKKFRRDLFRLQVRLYKAVKAGDKPKARSLQKLILKSQAARFLAIRQVTLRLRW